MNDADRTLERRIAALRDAFDRSFAEARAPDPAAGEDLLAIAIGTEPYALRLSEIAGLFPARKITRLPGGPPALLGIAGFRRTILPVYDLAALLGHPREATVRWLAMAAAAPIAVALATVEGHRRVASAEIVAHERGAPERRHVRDFARSPGLVRPIVHLPSILDAIRAQTTPTINQAL
jgi:purine-binding chemotaxis protein CheW